MLTQAHCAPTPVAQSLNFRDRMAWFHKQSAATGSCADDEVITRGGPQRKLGTMLDTSAMGERMIELPCPRDCGEVVLFLFSNPAEQKSMLVVLLSPQCQGKVNGFNAISGAQSVYPHKHNSKEDIYLLITEEGQIMRTMFPQCTDYFLRMHWLLITIVLNNNFINLSIFMCM